MQYCELQQTVRHLAVPSSSTDISVSGSSSSLKAIRHHGHKATSPITTHLDFNEYFFPSVKFPLCLKGLTFFIRYIKDFGHRLRDVEFVFLCDCLMGIHIYGCDDIRPEVKEVSYVFR